MKEAVSGGPDIPVNKWLRAQESMVPSEWGSESPTVGQTHCLESHTISCPVNPGWICYSLPSTETKTEVLHYIPGKQEKKDLNLGLSEKYNLYFSCKPVLSVSIRVSLSATYT